MTITLGFNTCYKSLKNKNFIGGRGGGGGGQKKCPKKKCHVSFEWLRNMNSLLANIYLYLPLLQDENAHPLTKKAFLNTC